VVDAPCLLTTRLKRAVPYDTIAVFSAGSRVLTPKFTCGEDARLFASLEVPLDVGLSGWVAENRKPVANGNPAVEAGYDGGRLQSALSIPLEAGDQLIGVVTLYRFGLNAFSAEDLQLMLATSSVFVAALANATQVRVPVSTRKRDFVPHPAFALQQASQPLLN